MRVAIVISLIVGSALAGSFLIAAAGSEHDLNRDGTVDLHDALDVLAHFGEAAPTATPSPAAPVGIRFPEVVLDRSDGLTVLGEVDEATCPAPVFQLEAWAEEATQVYVSVNGVQPLTGIGGSAWTSVRARTWQKVIVGTDVFGRSGSFGSTNWGYYPVRFEAETELPTTLRLTAICPTS